MAKRSFVKSSILKVGVHSSPDGDVDVTPARLKHWEREHKRLTKNGLVVPAHWDHSDKLSMLSPITVGELKERKTRSAKNTVGKMLDFTVNRDGQSATIKFETFDPKAAEGFENNALHVSPVILPEFVDGKRNEYTDALTHLDFVNYPVDHSQGPAIPLALRFGLSKEVYRLADDTDGDDDKKKKKKVGDSGDDSDDDTNEFNFGDDDADDAIDDTDTGIMDQSGSDTPENPDMPPQPTDNSKTEAILAGLSTMGLVLPSDFSFSGEGSLDVFLAALNTKIAADAAHDADNEPDPNDQQQQQGGDTLVDPTIQTMSLQARSAFAFAERKHREEIAGNLETILKSGRCTPAEYAARKKQSGAVKLSLDASGNATQSDVEKWIDSRKAVPEGTFWDEKAKTQNAKRLAANVVAHPAFVGDESEENADEVVDRMFGKKPSDD